MVITEGTPRPLSLPPQEATVVETAVGAIVVTARDGTITGVSAPGETVEHALRLLAPGLQPTAARGVLRHASEQLQAYARGELREFDLPLALPESSLRPFWDACARIPYGWTWSYGELAAAAGHPGEARTAGTAMATNPIAVVIPCHRVINSAGGLQGYGGGLEHKRLLLALEGAPSSKTDLAAWLRARHPADDRPLLGVRSTKIACLPDCRGGSRLDFEGHVLHSFGSLAEAERAGFRACKLCRPDAPQGRLIA
jgi:methylated-DNA-[protein]-cysteine S-methyltransferase